MTSVDDFPRWYRFEMVHSYPVISGVADPYDATFEELDAGFARCLANRNLRPTHEQFLAELSDGFPAKVVGGEEGETG